MKAELQLYLVSQILPRPNERVTVLSPSTPMFCEAEWNTSFGAFLDSNGETLNPIFWFRPSEIVYHKP